MHIMLDLKPRSPCCNSITPWHVPMELKASLPPLFYSHAEIVCNWTPRKPSISSWTTRVWPVCPSHYLRSTGTRKTRTASYIWSTHLKRCLVDNTSRFIAHQETTIGGSSNFTKMYIFFCRISYEKVTCI